MTTGAADRLVAGSRAKRAFWFAAGWLAVGVGGVGVVVPVLPTTVFFIIAASCFARSSPRFERWVLDLPRVGPMVRDYRAGLGMSRRAKRAAVTTMALFASLGVVLTREHLWVVGATAVLVAIGAWYIVVRVPTRERVLAAGGTDGPQAALTRSPTLTPEPFTRGRRSW
jgi:uncharacterized protein